MGDRALKPVSPRAIFDEALPYYLAIGMPYDLYWDGRPELVIPYRKADILRQKRSNNDAWLQGAYIRMAVASTLNKNAKYPTEPMNLFEEKPQDGSLTARQEKAKAAMVSFAAGFNAKMKKNTAKGGDVT